MKKILIFSLTYAPFVGGAEVAVEEITRRISEGYEWDIITTRLNHSFPKFEKIGNVNIYRVGLPNNQSVDLRKNDYLFKLNKYLYPILAPLKAYRLNKKKKYNAIWSIMASYAGLASLFFKTVKSKIPFILTLQEGDTSEHVRARMGPASFLLKQIFIKADYIHAISNYLVNFASDFGCKKEIIVIPNGVNLKVFSSKDRPRSIDFFKVITASRLVPKNGITDLINAMSYLDVKYTLDILGSGPLDMELKRQVIDKRLSGRINFIGELPQKEVAQYLARAAVFVRPSISEGLGNSFLEAMAIGLPVVGTAVGGITDFLFDGITGLVCRVNHPESVAEKIKLVCENQELRSSIILNAKKLIADSFTWESIVERFKLNIFDKVI